MKKIQEFVSHHENLVEICNDNHEMVESLKETFVDIFKLDKRVIKMIIMFLSTSIH
jgi:hypothetical protein